MRTCSLALQSPRIDVIVPCYKYGGFLRQCVQSALDQVGVDVRVLVIDDASPDNTAEVAAALAREDPRVTVISHGTNKGHISTYNEGIQWASATYMLLLSADDYLLPGALQRATSLMSAHPEVGFTFGNAIELSDNGHQTPTTSTFEETRTLEGHRFIEFTGAQNLVTTCTAVVRTELQRELGGYRDELPHAGDMEMWLRLAAHASVGFICALQGVYRQHGANMSTAYYHISRGQIAYVRSGRLADLLQRKAALDCFTEHCRRAVPECEYLCPGLYRRLSELAVSGASAAFNEGDMEDSSELSELALAILPEIRRSSAWTRLACKRWIGARTWRAVRPAAAALRAIQVRSG